MNSFYQIQQKYQRELCTNYGLQQQCIMFENLGTKQIMNQISGQKELQEAFCQFQLQYQQAKDYKEEDLKLAIE